MKTKYSPEIKQKVYKVLNSTYAVWHGCVLKKAENGTPKGTLCDVCTSEINTAMKNIFG